MPRGRPKNSLPKNKQFLLNRLQDEYGKDFHPIMQIAKNCHELQKAAESAREDYEKELARIADLKRPTKKNMEELRKLKNQWVTATRNANFEWDRMANYTEPKLKALEHSLSDDTVDELGALMDELTG